MKVHETQSGIFVGVVAAAAAVLVLTIAGLALAQGQPPAPQPQWGTIAPPPPPPPPPGAGAVSNAPPPPPPPPPAAPAAGKGAAAPAKAPPPPPAGVTTAPPAAATSALDPLKEREIIDAIVEGKRAISAMDPVTARLQFEQAFAKCDEYGAKGKLLARVYMALGALYAGFMQAVPQGTEFMRLALTTDPTVEPERELVNEMVTATFTMVRERLGIVGPAKINQAGGGQGAGGFWVMKHNRILQAKRMYPLGIYMETNPMVAVQAARLYFRLPSDQTYQVADMQRNKSMYGLLIGCDAIALLDPDAIYYYIEVVGGDGSIIAAEGSLSAPIEIRMVDDTLFQGVHPILPGMPQPEKCNPDDAAPCPPWDQHCHDIPCATEEDCVGGKVCSEEGYCVEGGGKGGEDGKAKGLKAIGLSINVGLGMGAGIVGGRSETAVDEWDAAHEIKLASGLSPSWMFMRAGIGWLFLKRFELGLWTRLQNISSDSMKFAGMGSREKNGPMWGLYGSFYYFGDGKLMGPGQLVGEDKKLKDKQGLRLYARLEFNFYGAVYHEIKLSYTTTQNGSEEHAFKRQRASGMQAFGVGPGILYGVHKYIDVGAELMYDYVGMGTDTWAHNFDLWLFLRAHF
jgi:hypothetical protein